MAAQQITAPGAAPELVETAPTAADRQAAIDAELFYEVLVGEMSAAQGDHTNALALLLDAARQSASPQLYKRAADIGLQSRSGERALMAARAWQQAYPDSRDANRYVLQILLVLNRVSDTQEPLTRELAATPGPAKPATYLAIAQLYSRVSDKALAAAVVEQALQADLKDPIYGPSAWATIGHMRIIAGQKTLALQAAQHADALSPNNGATALLALELMEAGIAQAEPMVLGYLEKTPSTTIRMAYARVLLGTEQIAKGREQIERITIDSPSYPDAWMALATLQAQAGEWPAAELSLHTLIPLAEQIPDTGVRAEVLTQAYLLGARTALAQKKDGPAMEWLDKVPEGLAVLNVQTLRATVLARQGQLPQARALIRAIPAQNPEQEALKRRAEVQLLRDSGAPQEAYLLQRTLHEQAPQDIGLAYDTALLAERAGKFQAMEKLLRDIIARQPDHQHAYNALGYSLAERGIRLEEAEQLISKALELAPNDPFITDSLAWVAFRQGQLPRALELLEKAYALRDDVEIAAHLGEVLWAMGNRQRAQAIWRQALQRDSENATLRETLKRLGVQP